MSDLAFGLASLIDALPAYVEAGEFYDGSVSELFFSSAMQRQLAKSNNDKLRINLARIAVEVVVDRLEVAAITVSDEKASDTLAQLSADNELDLVLPSVFRTACVYGDAYLILDGDSDSGVNLFDNSPLTTRVIYSAENPRIKAFAIKRWQANGYVRVNLYYAARTERYVTSKKDDKGVKASEFEPYTTQDDLDDSHIVPNSYGFIPVYHFRAGGRPYGVPEHKEAYGPQHAINKLAITHLATIDYLGFPQRYIMAAQGGDGSDIDDFDADFLHDPNTPEAVAPGPGEGSDYSHPTWGDDATGRSGLRADPGGVWTLPNGSNAGQFEAADSANFIDSLTMYVRLMAQATNTALHYFDPQTGTPSGESLRAADAPLIKRVRNRAMSFAGTLQDSLNDALSLFGFDDVQVAVHWANPESNDTLDNWQVAAAREAAGMPTYNALQMAGITDDQLAQMGIRPDTIGFGDAVAKLTNLGKALQGLSAAVTAGILSADSVQSIISALLGDAAPDETTA